MKKLGDFIIPALNKRGLGRTALPALVCFYAKEWSRGRFRVISFSRGSLKVAVVSASAAMNLQIEEEKLIEHLNQKLCCIIVKKVRIINQQIS